MRLAVLCLATAVFLGRSKGSAADRLAAAEAELVRLRRVVAVLDGDPNTTWAHEVIESPANEGVHELGDSALGVDAGFHDVHEVYASTCIALLIAIFVVVFAVWRYIPWDGELFGFKTGTLKMAFLMLSWCAAGASMMMLVEGYAPVTAFYVMAQIVTTVGYGDFTPTKWYTQLFMSFYCILCILVIAGTVSQLADAAMQHVEEQMQSKFESRQGEQTPLEKWWAKYGDVTTAALVFSSMILAGTLYFGGFEGCTCSYGVSAIAGCSDRTQDECRATGGSDLTYMEAFYMSCITLTTVGFGDFSAMSWHGRIFATFWMVLGVASTGNFVRAFSQIFLGNRDHSMDLAECFHQIDGNDDGYLSRFEFVCFALLETGMLNKQTLDNINAQYDALDTDKMEKVTLQQIQDSKSSRITLETQKVVAANSILSSGQLPRPARPLSAR